MRTFFFPKEAFRELLLNAVIHRDYTRPTPIQIRVYAHKIRIWNIGKMPVDVPVEKLFKPHSSEPRNPNIANVFFKAGYAERKQGKIIPYEDAVNPTINPTINPTLKLTDTQQTILAEISKNPNITQMELASILKIQRSSVSESMSKLQRAGVLKRVGGHKTGYWEIVE